MTGQHLCDFCSQIFSYYQVVLAYSAEVRDVDSGGLAICSVPKEQMPKAGIFCCFLSTLKSLLYQIRV